ncbi:MAG: hypothetical protein HZB66_01585 [Candidatus Aenigmarchaeota archaeon]|nr:hypothetical protein [Candidatus Aenigmarchaeota archaeon]
MFLLVGERIFLVREGEKINTQYGIIDVRKAKPGKTIKSSLGKTFLVMEPSLPDMLKKCKRGPQIIMPKDACQIVAVTGVCPGWRCLDAGGGSGFLSLFLANIVKPTGAVTAYEREKCFADIIKHNIKLCDMGNIIKLKNKDILKGFSEKNLNLITLDMKDAEKIIPKAFKSLKTGGWLCVYSPHIEQQKRAVASMGQFSEIKTIETIQREWQVDNSGEGYTHPKPSGILHTGFMTFGRKVR